MCCPHLGSLLPWGPALASFRADVSYRKMLSPPLPPLTYNLNVVATTQDSSNDVCKDESPMLAVDPVTAVTGLGISLASAALLRRWNKHESGQ